MTTLSDTQFLEARPLATIPTASRPVAIWLFVVAAMVFGMVILGGSTRLTNSGLSITEWKPITGALPPLSPAAWLAEFHNYQRIPQFKVMNPDMTLGGFKTIYWWEWSHRLLGRVIGLAFAAPFFLFLATRRLPRRLVWRCWVLLGLGGMQGFVGWWMVASGLSQRTEVAPERLTTHLGLALIVFCGLVWTGLEAWAGPSPTGARARSSWPAVAAGLAVLVFCQILLGGLVAGNRAGLIYNDWPLYAGQLWPAAYRDGGFWHTTLHSLAAVQAHHRMVAYLLFALTWIAAIAAIRSKSLPRPVGMLALLLAALVTVQAVLGVGTLMMQVPLGMAVAHQATAALVLAAAVGFAWRTRRA
jgi:cytochrome c oxidase assembly protein subunit 15